MLVSLAVVKTKWQITVDLIKFQALSHWLHTYNGNAVRTVKWLNPSWFLISSSIGHCWIIWSMYVVTLSLRWEPKPHFLGAWYVTNFTGNVALSIDSTQVDYRHIFEISFQRNKDNIQSTWLTCGYLRDTLDHKKTHYLVKIFKHFYYALSTCDFLRDTSEPRKHLFRYLSCSPPPQPREIHLFFQSCEWGFARLRVLRVQLKYIWW